MSGSWVSSLPYPYCCFLRTLLWTSPCLLAESAIESCLTSNLRLVGRSLELHLAFEAMQVHMLPRLGTKWVWIPGAFYLRLVGRPLEVYQYLEPLYNDYRKVRLREADGSFALTHMDEVVDQLLNNEYLFDIALPRIPNR